MFTSLLMDLRALEDGAALDEGLAAALAGELSRQAEAAAGGASWSPPQISQLYVRRGGPLQEWNELGNVCLAGEGASEPQVGAGLGGLPAAESILILGRRAKLHRVATTGARGLIVVGDDARLDAVTLSVGAGSTIMIGEGTTATFVAQLDARNGGAILVGPDGLWAHDLRIITDDMHAIRDLATNVRLNRYGGRVIIGRHVWFGERAAVIGDCRVGADTVVGMGSLITNAEMPANCVCAGWPARPIRTGTTWTRQDAP